MESWLSGRKRLTANEVRVLKPFVGSNPTLSAKMKFLSSTNYIIWLIFSALFFAFAEFLSKKFALTPKFSLAALVIVVDMCSTALWLPAMLQKNSLSITGTMWSILSLVLTVLIGILIFGEKLSTLNTIGIVVAFVAIILLSIG